MRGVLRLALAISRKSSCASRRRNKIPDDTKKEKSIKKHHTSHILASRSKGFLIHIGEGGARPDMGSGPNLSRETLMTPDSTYSSLRARMVRLSIFAVVMLISSAAFAADPVIKKSDYGDGDHKIEFKVVKAGRRASVTVSSLESGQILGTYQANKEGKLEKTI